LFILDGRLRVNQIKYFRSWVSDLKVVMMKQSRNKAGFPFQVRGASIQIGVDKNDCKVRLVDLASLDYKHTEYVDEGFIFGLETLDFILSAIMEGPLVKGEI
jgi:hypothetical protein